MQNFGLRGNCTVEIRELPKEMLEKAMGEWMCKWDWMRLKWMKMNVWRWCNSSGSNEEWMSCASPSVSSRSRLDRKGHWQWHGPLRQKVCHWMALRKTPTWGGKRGKTQTAAWSKKHLGLCGNRWLPSFSPWAAAPVVIKIMWRWTWKQGSQLFSPPHIK